MSDVSPSLINWVVPRHSARPVSYCPDWLRLPRTKPENKKQNQKEKPSPFLPRSVEPRGTTPSWPRLVSLSSAQQLMLQHAIIIALVKTECNMARDDWLPATVNVHVPTGRSSGLVWPSSKPLAVCYLAYVPLRPPAGIVASDAPNFPRSPLITNVGGCGGQSSGHAPPRRLVPNWCSSACVNLKPKPIESNISLSFETAASTTALRDTEPPHLVARRVVTYTQTAGRIQTWPYQVASSGPRSTMQRSIRHLTRMVTPRRD